MKRSQSSSTASSTNKHFVSNRYFNMNSATSHRQHQQQQQQQSQPQHHYQSPNNKWAAKMNNRLFNIDQSDLASTLDVEARSSSATNRKDHRKSAAETAMSSSNTFSHVSNSNRNPDANYSRVSKSMWEYYSGHYQSYECFSRKMQLKEAIYEMLKESIPQIGAYIVGSSANGFGTNQSDVDICLMLTENEIDQKVEAIQILKLFSRALKKAAFIRRIQVIHAKVPIIKFHDSQNDLDCDINLNNHIGIRNTHLLKSYSELDWRVRPFVLNIKRWAKYHNINDASQATISSYSLVLMAIFYLQKICEPPVLPVLQDLYPEKFNKNIPVYELRLNEKLPTHTSENKNSIGQLFYGFLEFYSNFNFQHNVISVRKGDVFPRSTLPTEDIHSPRSQWKYILIEEPFDSSNTARSVHDEYVFNNIVRVFIRSKKRLEDTKNLSSLFREKFYDDQRFSDY